MSGFNDDDRVMATAQHILRTLGSHNANDMLRILSTFDDRFSRFSLEAAIPASLEATAPDFEIGNVTLQTAEAAILKWDFGSSESARQTFIWTDNQDETGPYLDAIKYIQDLINNPPPGTDPAVIDNAQNVLQLAMLRLEEEFRNLMERYGESTDPDWLFDITYNNGEGGQGDQKSGLPELDQDEKSCISTTIDLLPPETVSDLCNIATAMVRSGYQTECTQVFVGNRRTVLEESLQRLGLERLTIEEVQRMPWELLESEIAKWTYIMKLAIGLLFRSEKRLCESVFNNVPTSLSDSSFVDFARVPMKHLLNFGEAIAIRQRAPEKLFKILDVYEALRDLLPSIEALFAMESCAGLRSEASAILNQLADAARGTFAEFENAVQRESSRNPVPGGAVHPLTRYVMNYVRFFSDYTKTLNQLLKERKEGQQAGSFSNRSQETGNKDPLSAVTLTLMGLLEKNLDGKSKLYKDPALTCLFLMNNLHYMVQKSKDAEIRKLVGDEWIKRHSGKLHQYHNDYRRTAWTKVLACLRDDGIKISGGSSSGASRNEIKERFKNFNAAFEENVKAQSGWIVSDSQLCAELQISITGMLLPAYRSFLGRFQNHLDVVRHPEKYVKYTPDDVEGHLNELFEGRSGSMNRRKSLSTAGVAL